METSASFCKKWGKNVVPIFFNILLPESRGAVEFVGVTLATEPLIHESWTCDLKVVPA